MKKSSSDFIFRLIKSLTKSEKRYFKIYSNRFTYKDKQKYMDLFDAIDKQKEYDEEALKKKFAGEKFLKHFPTVKTRLKDMVLEGLIEFEGHEHNNYKPQRNIRKAINLLHKGFSQESERLIKQAKQLIGSNELALSSHLKATELQWVNLEYEDIDAIDSIYQEEQEVLKKLKHFQFYRWAFNKTYAYYVKYGLHKEKLLPLLEEIIQNPLFQDENLPIGDLSKIYFYDSWSLYYFVKEDFENHFLYRKKSMALLPNSKNVNGKQYIAVIINYCSACLHAQKYESYQEGLKQLKEWASQRINSKERRMVFYYVNMLEANFFIAKKDWSGGWEHFQQIASQLPTIHKGLSQRYMIEIYHHIIYFGVINLQFEEILDYLEKLVKIRKPSYRQMLATLHILYCILHYEMGNFQYLESALVSIPRYLKKNDMLSENNKLFFSLLKKLLSAIQIRDYHEEIISLKEKLIQKKSYDIGGQINQLIVNWLDAKTENHSLKEILKETF